MPLGNLQKGSFDVSGAIVEIIPVNPSPSQPTLTRDSRRGTRRTTPGWILRVRSPSSIHPIELGVETKDEALEWATTIRFIKSYFIFELCPHFDRIHGWQGRRAKMFGSREYAPRDWVDMADCQRIIGYDCLLSGHCFQPRAVDQRRAQSARNVLISWD